MAQLYRQNLFGDANQPENREVWMNAEKRKCCTH